MRLAAVSSLMTAEAACSLYGWRSASFDSPRLAFRYEDVPLCEMLMSNREINGTMAGLAERRPQGVVEKWWSGGSGVCVDPLFNLSAENGLQEICKGSLRKADVHQLDLLLQDNFWYSYMLPDNHEVRVPLGHKNETGGDSGEEDVWLYAHKTFHVFKNADSSIRSVAIVPSAKVPLKVDRELRMTYDVVEYNDYVSPVISLDFPALYHSLAVMAILGVLALAFRTELRTTKCNTFDARLGAAALWEDARSPRLRLALAIAIGSGLQLVSTLAVGLFINAIASAWLHRMPYSNIRAWLWAYALSQPLNGFAIFRLFRLYKMEAAVTSAVFGSLLSLPIVVLMVMWQLNSVFAVVHSSRHVSLVTLVLKFAVYVGMMLLPLHYLGGIASQKWSRSRVTAIPNGDLTLIAESRAPHYVMIGIPLLLSTFPFGAALLPLRTAMEAAFNYSQFLISPSVEILCLATFLAVVAAASVASIYINLHYGNPVWVQTPMLLGVGTAVWSLAYLLLWTSTSAQLVNLLEYGLFSALAAAILGAITAATAYAAGDAYVGKFLA